MGQGILNQRTVTPPMGRGMLNQRVVAPPMSRIMTNSRIAPLVMGRDTIPIAQTQTAGTEAQGITAELESGKAVPQIAEEQGTDTI
jgi:hypothetical protein